MKHLTKAIAVAMVCGLALAGTASGANAQTAKPAKAHACGSQLAAKPAKVTKASKPATKVKGRHALAKQASKPVKPAKAAKSCAVA